MKLMLFSSFDRQIIVRLLLLGFIFGCAILLRVYNLEKYPSEIHVDELSNIYDGYSLSETGADRSGRKAPVIIRGFGDNDYRPPLYVWLSAISIKFLGYSTFAGRLPSVVLGMLSLVLLFLVARKLGGERFAYLSLFLGAISPWHITFSRIALESAVLPSFFTILTIYLFLLAKESSFSLDKIAFLGFCIGFATNDYQSTKLTFFIISFLIFLYLIHYSITKFNVVGVFILCTAIGASPQIFAAITMHNHFFSRATGTMMPFGFSITYFFQLLENFYVNLSPQFLFMKFGTYNNLTISRLLISEMSFFYFGLFMLYWRLKKYNKLNPFHFYALILIFILPSALTLDNPHALRTSGNIILFPMITASGILMVSNFVKKGVLRHAFLLFLTTLILINFIMYVRNYIDNAELSSVGQQNLLVKLGLKINEYQNLFENIYIEDIGNQPYIYIISYCNIPPVIFQKMQKENIGIGWDHFRRVGQFYFVDSTIVIENLSNRSRNNLGILKEKIEGYCLIDSISIHGEKLFFYKN